MDATEVKNSRSSIVRNQVWDSTLAQLYSLDFSELVFCLSSLDSVDSEATLGVVDKSEMFAGLFNADHIHETSWVRRIGSDFSIDLDETLHDDLLDFAGIESILETTALLVQSR